MRRGGHAIAVTATLAILLAVWVTSTDTIHLFSPARTAPARIHRLATNQKLSHNKGGLVGQRPSAPSAHAPAWLTVTQWVFPALIAVFLATFLALAFWRSRKDRQTVDRVVRPPETEDPIDAMRVPPKMIETARRQVYVLREGTPRNAIVACWMELERTCEGSGFPRHPAETSSEFTTRVLAHYVVDAEAVDSLSALYREARFSEHDLLEPHREGAISALQQILTELERLPTRESAPSGVGSR